MKSKSYKLILKYSKEDLKECIEKLKKLQKQEEEDELAGVCRLRIGSESSVEYWFGKIEIFAWILGYSQKELDILLEEK